MHPRLSSLRLLAIVIIAGSPCLSWACSDFYKKLPNVTQTLCQEAQLKPSGARSVQGRALLVRDVVPLVARRRVLVVAAMHGDEFSSASVELPNALRTPTDAEIGKMWTDLRNWMDHTLGENLAQSQP